MGLHRLPSDTNGPEGRRQRLLFWFTYACDKGLALTFGRTPNIHDYDITIERPRIPEDVQGGWGYYYIAWMNYAELQGKVLEQLFSAQAQKESQEVRTKRARVLAVRLHELNSEFYRVSEGVISAPTVVPC